MLLFFTKGLCTLGGCLPASRCGPFPPTHTRRSSPSPGPPQTDELCLVLNITLLEPSSVCSPASGFRRSHQVCETHPRDFVGCDVCLWLFLPCSAAPWPQSGGPVLVPGPPALRERRPRFSTLAPGFEFTFRKLLWQSQSRCRRHQLIFSYHDLKHALYAKRPYLPQSQERPR